MITIDGQYFDGRQPIGVPAKMVFEGNKTTLIAEAISEGYSTEHIKISPRIDTALRFIAFPNGAQFVCPDYEFFDSLPQENPSEGPVSWLEKRWGIALTCLVVIFWTLLIAYFFGLPIVADRIAVRIPIKTEQILGRDALSWLDKKEWFKPTKIDPEKQKTIADGFGGLRSNLPLENYYDLEFRSSKMFGPNALSLPGGIIVITDDMVNEAQTTEEVLAVLAHELGHAELRHTMRSVLQNSVVAAVVATMTSDAASLSVAVASLPALLAQTKYSRKFEAEADEYAFKLLKQKGYSPMAFASIMERLAEKNETEMGAFAYISSHPVTAERVKRARDAATK